MTVTQYRPRADRVNGGPPRAVTQLPAQRPVESWQIMKQWADQRGWGSWRCAGAMIRAATPEERRHLPSQQVLSGYWQRWLKGEHIPDAHRSDPNARGLNRRIIARMLGTTPDKLWPVRKKVPRTAAGDLKDERDRTAGHLAEQRRKLAELRRQVQLIPQVEDAIARLEDELRYLDAVLAIPAPGEHRAPGAASA